MKLAYAFIVALLFTLTPTTAHAALGWTGQKFTKIYYFEHGGKGSLSGKDAGNAMDIVDQTIAPIEAGVIISNVYMIVDTAITGTTAINVGDDDNGTGFIASGMSVTLATPGLYGWSAKLAGAYLRSQTAGATDALDVYVVPNAKFYSTAKSLIMDITTANTAGKFRVIVEGFKVGA